MLLPVCTLDPYEKPEVQDCPEANSDVTRCMPLSRPKLAVVPPLNHEPPSKR